MNRLPPTLLAVTIAFCTAAPVFADRASLSFSAGGVAIAIDAEVPPEPPTPHPAQASRALSPPRPVEGVRDLDESAFFAPDPFVPDVHPSRHDATRAAGSAWAKLVADRRQSPGRVRMMAPDSALYAPLQEGIRSRLPDLAVEPCDGTMCAGGTPPAGEAWLHVDVAETATDRKPRRVNQGPNNVVSTGTGGTVSIRSAGASDAAVLVKFVDKPWLADPVAFAGRTPGAWIVARSDPARPATSPLDARNAAREAAAEDVLPLVLARLPREGRYDRANVRRIVEHRLLGDNMVADRFPQKFERGYGNLYREAVLVDASDAQLATMAGEVRRSLDAQQATRRNGFLAAGAILLVTYALYRLANAFTKGYFTWSLRTAAAIAAAGAVTAVVALV